MYKELQCKVVHMAEVMKNSGYTYDTICCIKRGAFGYVEYLQMFGLLPSEETRDQYLDWLESSFIENRSYYLATRKRAVNRFLMFMETGNCNSRNPIKRHQFYGAFSREMNDFIEHLHGQFMANVTISEYHHRLRHNCIIRNRILYRICERKHVSLCILCLFDLHPEIFGVLF